MKSLILLALIAVPSSPAVTPIDRAQPSRVDDTPAPAKETRVVTLDITGMT